MTPVTALRRLAPAVLLVFLGLQALLLSRTVGLTYDETVDSVAGLVYRSYRNFDFFSRESPPLTDELRAAALAPLAPELPRGLPAGIAPRPVSPHEYGQVFLFANRVPAETLIERARLVSVLLLLLLGAAVWSWARAAGGETAAAFALAFLAFEPNLLAHGSLANPDIGVAAFSTAALACWASWLRRPAPARVAAAGLFLGAAMCSKATGLAVLPAMILSSALTRRPTRKELAPLAGLVAAAATVVLLVYGPSQVWRYGAMLAYRSRQMKEPTPVWFFGRTYSEGNPWYFLGVLLLKTTLPLLAGTIWFAAAPRLRKRYSLDHRVVASFAGLVLLAALAGKRQLGVRYILPVYPLFALAAGLATTALWEKRRARVFVLGALAWHAGSSIAAFPHDLAYFNELAGIPARGIDCLGDSNLDWGQSIPELADFARAHPGGLVLSYFGTDCPRERGLVYQDAFSTPSVCPGRDAPLPVDLKAEWLAVGATKWQGYYESGPPAWGWLRSRTPVATLAGGAMLVYDLSRDADAHRELAALYDRGGRPEFAARERARALALSSE